jgi:hypothetical protein
LPGNSKDVIHTPIQYNENVSRFPRRLFVEDNFCAKNIFFGYAGETCSKKSILLQIDRFS